MGLLHDMPPNVGLVQRSLLLRIMCDWFLFFPKLFFPVGGWYKTFHPELEEYLLKHGIFKY